MRSFLLMIGIVSFSLTGLFAQERTASHDSNRTVSVQSGSALIAQEESGPVAVPNPSDKALRYFRSGNVLWVVDRIWGLLIPSLFLFTGYSAKIRNWAQKLGRKWFFTIGLYFILFTLINFVVDFPLSYYESFVRQHAYDLSNQTFGKWFGDSLKSELVGINESPNHFPKVWLERS